MTSTETNATVVVDKLEELFEADDHLPCTWDDEEDMACLQPAVYRHVCHCGNAEQFCVPHFAFVKLLESKGALIACRNCMCPLFPQSFFPI